MRNTVLIAEDSELNRELLRELLEEKYSILEAEDGAQALELIKNQHKDIAVLLLDIVMPNMSGLELLDILTEQKLTGDFPILIISGDSGMDVEEQCLLRGVTDFIRKPFSPNLVQHRIRNALSLFSLKNSLADMVEEQTRQIRSQTEDLRLKNIQLEQMHEDTIDLISDIVEARSLESGQHVRRVKGFTEILARCVMRRYPEYGLDEHRIQVITQAAAMHDIGKIVIADAVLLKPGKLTSEEFEYIKTHTTAGARLLEKSRDMWDEEYYEICHNITLHHHEKWDGRGYPEGLAGDNIPIEAQMVAVADCFDALTTERVYKAAYSCDKAFAMITGGECGAFSPRLMECFTDCREAFNSLAMIYS